MFSRLKEGLTAAVKTSREYIFSTQLCHASAGIFHRCKYCKQSQ